MKIHCILFPGCFALLLVASVGRMHAQDTLRTVDLVQHTVQASTTENFTRGSSAFIVDSTFLSSVRAGSLSDVMAFQTGAYIKTYGNGMSATISFRGTGAERTNVLWNGFSINSASLGQSDFSIFPAAAFNRIRIQPGPSAANFGNASMGGTVSLSYQPSWKKDFSIRLHQEYGSFNSLFSNASASYGNAVFQGRTQYIRSSSDNNFAFRNLTVAGFPVEEQVNSAYVQHAILQDLFFRAGKTAEIEFHGWFNDALREIPPAMGSMNAMARQTDQNLRLSLSALFPYRWGSTRISAAFFNDVLNYRDIGIQDQALVRTYQAQVEQDVVRWDRLLLKAGGNIQYFTAAMTFYTDGDTEWRGGIFAMLNYTPSQRLRFSFNARQQLVQGFQPPPTGVIGGEFDIVRSEKKTLTAKISISNGYRVPTLNDRYWVPGGSDTIVPEYSWNFESSFQFRHKIGPIASLEATVTGYYGFAENWIQWNPTPMGYWAPKNIGNVVLGGLEVSEKLILRKGIVTFSPGIHYALAFAIDRSGTANDGNQLSYVPLHVVNLIVSLDVKGYYLNLNGRFTGSRYTLADESRELDPYFLLNLSIGKSFNLRHLTVSPLFRIANLTAAEYQSIEYRPSAGITYSIGAELSIHKNNFKNK